MPKRLETEVVTRAGRTAAGQEDSDPPVSDPTRSYHVYGLRVRSAVPLPFDPLPEPPASELPAT